MYIIPLSHLPTIAPLDKAQAAAQTPDSASVPVFGDVLKNALENMEQTQQVSAQDSYDLALGKTDDLHSVQINSMKSSAAVELTAGIASRVISAYKEILQTQL